MRSPTVAGQDHVRALLTPASEARRRASAADTGTACVTPTLETGCGCAPVRTARPRVRRCARVTWPIARARGALARTWLAAWAPVPEYTFATADTGCGAAASAAGSSALEAWGGAISAAAAGA
jgi:hypothetical protein